MYPVFYSFIVMRGHFSFSFLDLIPMQLVVIMVSKPGGSLV